MDIRVLPASLPSCPGFSLTGFVIDGVLAVDAGPLGLCGLPEELAKITDILLTHSHIDHVAGLPIFLDNVYGLSEKAPTIHATTPTLNSLQNDIFNDRVMPDFIGMSKVLPPFLQLNTIRANEPFRIGRYTIHAREVIHPVPTVAYLIDDGTAAIAIVTDTAPVPDLLAWIAKQPRLRAVFLEASFPKDMRELAGTCGHHTSEQFVEAARALAPLPVYPTHIKPRFVEIIRQEIVDARLPNVRFIVPGDVVEV